MSLFRGATTVLKGIDMGKSRGLKPVELSKLVRELCKAHLGGELRVRARCNVALSLTE
jgi:hypothetical protein